MKQNTATLDLIVTKLTGIEQKTDGIEHKLTGLERTNASLPTCAKRAKLVLQREFFY